MSVSAGENHRRKQRRASGSGVRWTRKPDVFAIVRMIAPVAVLIDEARLEGGHAERSRCRQEFARRRADMESESLTGRLDR